MVSFGTVQKKTYELIGTGEYVFTLNDVGEISGDYGDRLQFDFLVAERDTPTEYIARSDGSPRVLRFWTDTEITLGSKQHQWMEALAGRTFREGDELPDGDELLSKRMLAYLTHYTPKKGKNQGVPKEDIVMGSAKPFSLGGRKNGATKPAPAAAPAAVDRNAVIAEIRKHIKRAVLADVDSGTVEVWQAINLDELSDEDLAAGLQEIKDAIQAAVAA